MSENIDNERGQTFTAQKPTIDPTAKAPTPEQIAEAIKHLRSIGSFTRDSAYSICNEAADLIEALAAQLAELHVEGRG